MPTRRGLGGIVAGDVIVGADGAKIATEGDLVAATELHQVGDVMTLRVRRGEGTEGDVTELDLLVTLEPAQARR